MTQNPTHNLIHTPPVVGEYAYYYSKSESNHWLVITEEDKQVACHYSVKVKLPSKPFVTCNGIIKQVTKEIKYL